MEPGYAAFRGAQPAITEKVAKNIWYKLKQNDRNHWRDIEEACIRDYVLKGKGPLVE